MKKMNKKGFTIVELVIVIAVIAILAAVLIPTFSNVISKANESAALQEARNAMTNDLVLAEADYANMDDFTGTDGKQLYAVSLKTGDSGDAVKGYYLKTASGDQNPTYTYVLQSGDGKAEANKEYYAAFAGKYTAGSGSVHAKYVYENAKYTCTYDCEEGGWTCVAK